MNSKLKILVTGAAGFIGFHLTKRLCDEGYYVIGVDNLNDRSIGIELENPGHEFGYIPFSRKQMSSLVFLCKKIKNKYNIKADWVLGHSDISPDRKLDPGKKFNWNLIKRIFK